MFRQLTKQEVKQIADIMLRQVFKRAEEKGIKIDVTGELELSTFIELAGGSNASRAPGLAAAACSAAGTPRRGRRAVRALRPRCRRPARDACLLVLCLRSAHPQSSLRHRPRLLSAPPPRPPPGSQTQGFLPL